ncbi:MAG: hypothetical protein ACLRMZ_25595 [Blautia marasmi]
MITGYIASTEGTVVMTVMIF